MGINENEMHLGWKEHLGEGNKNRDIRKICSNRGRPDQLKDKSFRGDSVDETAADWKM